MWLKTLAEKQGPYDQLAEKGRELLDKSEESEQHGINAILLNLAEAWEQVDFSLISTVISYFCRFELTVSAYYLNSFRVKHQIFLNRSQDTSKYKFNLMHTSVWNMDWISVLGFL